MLTFDGHGSSGPCDSSLRIVLLGYIVRGPVGGMAWHHLNYVRSLVDLGHEVLFMEDSDDYDSCYDPRNHSMGRTPEAGLKFAAEAFDAIGHKADWCYYDAHTGQWHGPADHRAIDFCRDADLLLNISGVNPLREWVREIPARALVDTDPLFTQIRNLQEPERESYTRLHTAFFTFGENIPAGTSRVPDDGIPWVATRQPVSLRCWPQLARPSGGCYSTVLQWDSYQTRTSGQEEFGMKSRSFQPYMELPRTVSACLSLAVGGKRAPRSEMRSAGWQVDDPMVVSKSVHTYREYIEKSRGEWSVAKHGYVAAHTGWFSERSACYLASGRPVVVQDTGWDACPRDSYGLRRFSDFDGARVALEEIELDHQRHCDGARQLAEALFAPQVVLQPMLEQVFASRPTRRAGAL